MKASITRWNSKLQKEEHFPMIDLEDVIKIMKKEIKDKKEVNIEKK